MADVAPDEACSARDEDPHRSELRRRSGGRRFGRRPGRRGRPPRPSRRSSMLRPSKTTLPAIASRTAARSIERNSDQSVRIARASASRTASIGSDRRTAGIAPGRASGRPTPPGRRPGSSRRRWRADVTTSIAGDSRVSSVSPLKVSPQTPMRRPSRLPSRAWSRRTAFVRCAAVDLLDARQDRRRDAERLADVAQRGDVLGQAASAEADPGPEEVVADPWVEGDPLDDLVDADADRLAQAGDLVDERDPRREEGVGDVLDHLGRSQVGDDHLAAERRRRDRRPPARHPSERDPTTIRSGLKKSSTARPWRRNSGLDTIRGRLVALLEGDRTGSPRSSRRSRSATCSCWR